MRSTEALVGQPEAAPRCAAFEIWPHRSLSRRGLAIVLVLTALAGLVVVVGHVGPALLPVTIGAVFSVSALALAFWCNNRAARRQWECVEIGPDVVRVVQHGPRNGMRRTVEFNTHWVSVRLDDTPRVANRIVLSQSGRRCAIGAFLSPDERKALAGELNASLARARRQEWVAAEARRPAP